MPRLVLSASAVVLGALGLLASFAPDAVLRALAVPTAPAPMLLVQLLGALAIAFALLNWLLRTTPLGGIYGRPLILANLVHFTSGALAAGKVIVATPSLHALWPVCALYAVLAIGFGALPFLAPARST